MTDFKFMIDIHCHILPDIDDGPETFDQSLAIAKLYVAAGFRCIAATPHCVPGTYWMPEPEEVREKIAALVGQVRAEGMLLHVYGGMEIALDPLVPRLLREGKVLTIADGPYVLIEAPFQRFPLGWEGIVNEVRGMGYKVLLAHPERCGEVGRKPGLVVDIAASGAFVQVNWDSLVGANGREAQRAALEFLEAGWIHCLATDTHGTGRRSPQMIRNSWAEVEGLVGKENLRRLIVENPRRVLMGGPLLEIEKRAVAKPAAALRRRWFWFSRG